LKFKYLFQNIARKPRDTPVMALATRKKLKLYIAGSIAKLVLAVLQAMIA
jgi:hypothetical protein